MSGPSRALSFAGRSRIRRTPQAVGVVRRTASAASTSATLVYHDEGVDRDRPVGCGDDRVEIDLEDVRAFERERGDTHDELRDRVAFWRGVDVVAA